MKTDTRHAVHWFEIPAANLPRATRFYEAVLDAPLRQATMGSQSLAVFPYDQTGVGGCLMSGMPGRPAADGSIVYLNATPSLDAALARATSAGGSVALPRTALPPGMGYFAHIIDSEGNRVGLHALN